MKKTKRRYQVARALLAAQTEAVRERDAEIRDLRGQVIDLTHALVKERVPVEVNAA